MIKIQDLYVWYETLYLRKQPEIKREGDNPYNQTTSK